jgi:uncharacterized protein YndB with AHSA1/START domain
MASTQSATQSLEVRRIIPASPERVYDAWTKPEILTRWFAPSGDYTVTVHGGEARAGGQYRIEMRHKNGASHVVVGEYREVRRPTRLVFTWKWEGTPMSDTVVTVVFRPNGRHTEVVLTHTGFATEPEREEHVKGWIGCLSRLETLET